MRHEWTIALAMVLPALLHAKEFHVAVDGSDSGDGTVSAPFETIQRAAVLAQPGDVVTVHHGVYRENVAPPRGGRSVRERITYRAAPGEEVIIKGSEGVKGWVHEREGVWRIDLPNAFFGDFNPYADEVRGDWFDAKGRNHHTGCVYLDGVWRIEVAGKDALFSSEEDDVHREPGWFAEVGEERTTIWAAFGDVDPNEALAEINVRQTVFYPPRPFVNYITVRGFKMRHAAPNWAPPTAEQIGLIGTHWSKGWIIEDNEISHSINTGVSLGKYGDEFDNAGPTAQAYLDSIDRARSNGWNKATIGSHIVRNNEISWCGQAGIVGSMGAAFSTISGNHVHHIYTRRRFSGAEMAGIKFHAPIDMLIEGNRIHDAFQGIWLDWMTQGTRVTRNLLYRNDLDLFLEVNHGPFVVDNNLFLSDLVKHHSQGGAYVHNLFGGVFGAVTDQRHTPYFRAHSTEKVADHVLNVGDDRFYNNVFVGRDGSHIDQGWWEGMKNNPTWRFGHGLWIYEGRPQPPQTAGNVYYDGAKPYPGEVGVIVEVSPNLRLDERGDEVFLGIRISPEQLEQETPLVTSELLGVAQVPQLPFETPAGEPVLVDSDYFGKKRNLKKPASGPFADAAAGENVFKVWPNQPQLAK